MLTQRQPDPIKRPFALIPLKPSGFAIVDVDDYKWLSRYRWRVLRSRHLYYAARIVRKNGKEIAIRMHREIAKPKPGEHTHHLNHNTYDNRRCNLENFTPDRHAIEHMKGGSSQFRRK